MITEKVPTAIKGRESEAMVRAGRDRVETALKGTSTVSGSAGKQSHEMIQDEKRGANAQDNGESKRNETFSPTGFDRQLSKDRQSEIRVEGRPFSAETGVQAVRMSGGAGDAESHRVLSEVKLPLETRALSNHILSLLSSQDKTGTQRVRVVLQPPNLGSLDMEVVLRDRMVRIVFRVDSGDIVRFLQAGTDQLKGSLQGQGFTMESLSVTQREQGGGYHSEYGEDRYFSHEPGNDGERGRAGNESSGETGADDGMHRVPLEDTIPGRLNFFI